MSDTQLAFQPQPFCVDDFLSFGRHYGIRFQFPSLGVRDDARASSPTVARGCVQEWLLRSGFWFTSSELDVLEPYESISQGRSPLLIVVILSGCVTLRVGAWQREFHPGMALSLRLGDGQSLHAIHLSGQRLKTATLALDPAHLAESSAHNDLLTQVLNEARLPFHPWRVPKDLFGLLQQTLSESGADSQRRLILEGLALQLVGHGYPAPPRHRVPVFPSGSRQRLETVRQLMAFAPGDSYSLQDLAAHAAMSPSSLRDKFRRTYGVSVFEYLRKCRLELAWSLLEQGHSVQQAAHQSGYRHATNFATAFRKHFRCSPSDIAGDPPSAPA
ncbi:AraC family transcriptional regulator [Tamilnaduibacter salinus]|uniref:AraC family transcriptional regulator n=1 Tax=Tamilnaduibacter salinus TaxID=1484056 RepID=A0A2A2I5L3_9GAMM|nr:helix-turn-helix transcriptional regulator [Tamilnaduibacter salinus]PAV26688.1 AraC family transcriptional regulator [Tamilnaduibacter salinus]